VQPILRLRWNSSQKTVPVSIGFQYPLVWWYIAATSTHSKERKMPLINCQDCGKEISDRAETCIHCGCPVQAQPKQDGPICPKCESTDITIGTKGFGLFKAAAGAVVAGPVGLLGGMIGSKKSMFVCSNCGHRWKPPVYPPDYYGNGKW
jgi:ribosomal protein L37E